MISQSNEPQRVAASSARRVLLRTRSDDGSPFGSIGASMMYKCRAFHLMIWGSKFKGPARSNWNVQIDPVWKNPDWNGNTVKSVEVFKSLKSADKILK
ncbi:hypothetical protein PF003_g5396 [Phytophthora fragariae]|nr:hypothetical protein PF003_g5396 [Phytophthora fragariae]